MKRGGLATTPPIAWVCPLVPLCAHQSPPIPKCARVLTAPPPSLAQRVLTASRGHTTTAHDEVVTPPAASFPAMWWAHHLQISLRCGGHTTTNFVVVAPPPTVGVTPPPACFSAMWWAHHHQISLRCGGHTTSSLFPCDVVGAPPPNFPATWWSHHHQQPVALRCGGRTTTNCGGYTATSLFYTMWWSHHHQISLRCGGPPFPRPLCPRVSARDHSTATVTCPVSAHSAVAVTSPSPVPAHARSITINPTDARHVRTIAPPLLLHSPSLVLAGAGVCVSPPPPHLVSACAPLSNVPPLH